MEEKKSDFIVSDRRKFTSDGELRSEPVEVEQASGETMRAEKAAPVTVATSSPASEQSAPAMPPPPSAAEQATQHAAYQEAGKKIDSMLEAAGAKKPADMQMTFERLIASLYMTAMMQLGMMREEDAEAQPDIIGAQQTIDTIGILNQKTKGNLTVRESNMIENCLFELRMAFLEITNLLTRPPQPGVIQPGAKK